MSAHKEMDNKRFLTSSWTEKGSRPVSEIKFFIKEWYSPPVNWFSGTIFTFMRANFKMKIACHTFMPKTCTELIEMSLRCLKMHNQIGLYNNPHILVCFVTYKLCQLLLHSFITSHKQQKLGANTSKWRRPNLAQYCLGLHNGNGTLRETVDGALVILKCIHSKYPQYSIFQTDDTQGSF